MSRLTKQAASDSLKYFDTECFETTHDLRYILYKGALQDIVFVM